MRAAVLIAAVLAGCARIPVTHHYTLLPVHAPVAADAAAGGPVLALSPLRVQTPYDDPRLIYRPDSQRLEYYDYHLWSSPPAEGVRDALRVWLEQSGLFLRVDDQRNSADAVLSGRLMALEEVDQSKERWLARCVIELALEDARDGATLWQDRFAREVPIIDRSPKGVSEALGQALEDIARQAAPIIAEHARAARDRHAAQPRSGSNARRSR